MRLHNAQFFGVLEITILQNLVYSRHNFTPGCCGFISTETAASWGDEGRFGFVADSVAGNEIGIAEKICVGYKAGFCFQGSYIAGAWHILSDTASLTNDILQQNKESEPVPDGE